MGAGVASAKYDGHDIRVIEIKESGFMDFSYIRGHKPRDAKYSNTVKIDKRLTTLDGKHNGGMKTAEELNGPGRRRLGWKPSDDIPRRREHFHHSFVNRVIGKASVSPEISELLI